MICCYVGFGCGIIICRLVPTTLSFSDWKGGVFVLRDLVTLLAVPIIAGIVTDLLVDLIKKQIKDKSDQE